MLFTKIFPERWFVWALVFLFVSGVGLIAYMQWVNLEMDTANLLMLSQMA